MKKSISYWSFSGKNVFEAMRLAKDAGFDGIELTLDAEGDMTMETAPEAPFSVPAHSGVWHRSKAAVQI